MSDEEIIVEMTETENDDDQVPEYTIPKLDNIRNELSELLSQAGQSNGFPPRWSIEAVNTLLSLCEKQHTYLAKILSKIAEANLLLDTDEKIPTEEITSLDSLTLTLITQCNELVLRNKKV